MKNAWVLSFPLNANAQADLSLRGCTCNFVGLVMHMLICLSDFSLSENRLYVNKGQELRIVNVSIMSHLHNQ